jgi:hypothetical protein
MPGSHAAAAARSSRLARRNQREEVGTLGAPPAGPQGVIRDLHRMMAEHALGKKWHDPVLDA